MHSVSKTTSMVPLLCYVYIKEKIVGRQSPIYNNVFIYIYLRHVSRAPVNSGCSWILLYIYTYVKSCVPLVDLVDSLAKPTRNVVFISYLCLYIGENSLMTHNTQSIHVYKSIDICFCSISVHQQIIPPQHAADGHAISKCLL